MYRILLTGFEPFAGMKTNVSEIVAKSLNLKSLNVELGESKIGTGRVRERCPKIEWHSKILSVDKNGSTLISKAVLSDSIDSDAIIHLGLARNASIPRIESRGLNMNCFSSPDNSGRIVIGEIIQGAPSEIPVSASIELIQNEGITHPYETSDDAGGFVCNETLFNTLHALNSKNRNIPCIFVHLPSEEFMSIDEQVEFVTLISAIVVQPRHIDVVGAIFENNGKWLASKRRGPIQSDKWEFPGGKIEYGETEHQALVRECKEELDWEITPVDRIMVIDYEYPEFTVTLHFWRCVSLSDVPPSTHSHSEHRWIDTSMLHNFDWLEADVPLIEYLQYKF